MGCETGAVVVTETERGHAVPTNQRPVMPKLHALCPPPFGPASPTATTASPSRPRAGPTVATVTASAFWARSLRSGTWARASVGSCWRTARAPRPTLRSWWRWPRITASTVGSSTSRTRSGLRARRRWCISAIASRGACTRLCLAHRSRCGIHRFCWPHGPPLGLLFIAFGGGALKACRCSDQPESAV